MLHINIPFFWHPDSMTPIGSRLKIALDDERHRMLNEWFFKWHQIGRQGSVEIESFRGKPIVYGGIKFSGSAHLAYWETIQLYLRKKISSIFDDVERELPNYPINIRSDAVEEATHLVSAFAAQIRAAAVEKDQILRGDGLNFPQKHDFGTWVGCGLSDVQSRAASLLRIYCQDGEKTTSWLTRANRWADSNRFLLISIGLGLSVLGILLTL